MVEQSSSKKVKTYTICTADARGHIKPLLQNLIEENTGWKETLIRDKYDFKWFPSNVEDNELVEVLKAKGRMTNRFPGIHGLAHKDTYTKIMKMGMEIKPDVFDFVPAQFNFPQDRDRFLEYHKSSKNGTIYIAKPVASSEGNSILLFRELSEVPTMLGQEMVVQRYIHNPLLVEGLKFDLRIYVVIVGTYPMSAFICNEGLARFCTEKYEKPTKENFKQFFMHLTNYSINKHSDTFVECENILEPNNATKRTVTSLMLTLQNQGVDTEKLKSNIKQTCARALSVYGPMIEHQAAVATNNKQLDGKYFQVLGFDILPDEDLNCYLLEINDHPSLDIYLEKDYMGGGMGKTLSQIDLYVKKTIVGDSIKFAKKARSKVSELNNFKSLEKIYPISSEEDPQAATVYQTLTKSRELYLQIAPVKSKENLTSSNFEKMLSKIPILKTSGLSSIDMQFMFQKAAESQKMIEFTQFFWLLKLLQEAVRNKQGQTDSEEIIMSTALLLMLHGHCQDQFIQQWNVTDSLQEEVALATLEEGRDLQSISWSLILRDNKYKSFFSWFIDFSIQLTNIDQKRQFDCANKNNNNLLRVTVMKRRTCLSSKLVKFTLDVEIFWFDLIDMWLDFSWGISKNSLQRKGYGSWKRNGSNKCNKGQYLDNKKKCPTCPQGCTDCLGPDKALSCRKNYTYVEGYSFAYCLPECQKGYYIQNYYTDEKSFKARASGSQTPTMAASQCKACDFGCEDCIYDADTGRSFCYDCLKGFEFDQKTGKCKLSECQPGQFRPKALTASTIKPTDKVEDYICRDCSNGCKNCTSNTTCTLCFPNHAMANVQKISKCFPCPAFCKNCSYSSQHQQAVCSKCEAQFYPINNGKECTLNRTCSQGQWFNDAKLACDSCPDRCTSCKQGSRNGTVVCTNCTADTKLDSAKGNVCVDRCNKSREYFDFKNNGCVTCKSNAYPVQNQQKCQPCTKYCDQCSLKVHSDDKDDDEDCDQNNKPKSTISIVVIFSFASSSTNNKLSNTSSQSGGLVEYCDRCQNGTTYVKSERKCRLPCDSTSYFNYTRMECVSCLSNQYLDRKTDRCMACPANCTSCVQAGNSAENRQDGGSGIVCKGCKGGLMLDEGEKRCRPKCTNASQYFDWPKYQCRDCPSGSVINFNTSKCDRCPSTCSECVRNKSTSAIECIKCTSTNMYVPETKQCRKKCPYGQTYFSESDSCRTCSPYESYSYRTGGCIRCAFGCIECFTQLSNQNSVPYCIDCDHNTVYDSYTGQCKLDCPTGSVFNYATLKCESCPIGQFHDEIFDKCRTCSNANCAVCVAQSNNSQFSNCTKCKEGYSLDQYYNCKTSCPAGQYMDSNSTCKNCPSGSYFSSSIKSCSRCPQNCTSCNENTNGAITCNNCTSGYILESSGNCRAPCGSEAPYYNKSLGQCQQCPTRTYFQSKTSSCVNCPANCSECYLDTTSSKPKCSGQCLNNWILDPQAQLCRPQCSSSQQYDWDLQKCSQCQAGQFLNSTTQRCQGCPNSGCMACEYNSANKSFTCQSCYSGFVFEASRMTCRPACSQSQYYDWSRGSCVSCVTGTYLDQSTQTCKTCPNNCASCGVSSTSDSTQQPSIECIACKSSYYLDTQYKRCRLSCNQTTYYNWTLEQCTTCSEGQFLNPDYEACQNCPYGCKSCSYNFNTKQLECTSCKDTTLILDNKMKLCRQQCNNTAYFNWTYQSCMNCKSSEYVEPVDKTSCVTCGKCPTCFYNSSMQVECTSCPAGQVLDGSIKACREQCNKTSYYDYKLGSCQQCRTGQWLNPNSGQCESCPLGCYKCTQSALISNTDKPDCTECLPGLVLDQFVCRKNCTMSQFYDWTISDCRECTAPCTQCESTQVCKACDEKYNLQTNGTCTEKCISGQQVWNNQTKTCEALILMNVSVTANTSKTIRCRGATFTANGLGYNSSPSYQWSYQIVSGGANKAQWQSDLDGMVNQAQGTNFELTRAFTEKITDITTLRIIVTMTSGGSSVSNSTQFVIEPYVYTTISNYTKSYTFYASDGLPLYPAFNFPECPAFQGPSAIPTTVSLGCMLYDSKGNMIKSLTRCQIKPDEVSPGLNFTIRYAYTPNPYQTAIRDIITVATVAQPPSCTIANATMTYVRQSDTLYLKVAVVNSRTGFKYQWQCLPQTSGAQCGVLSTTQNSPDLSLPASSMTVGANYIFTLNVLENTATQTSCSANVEVVPTSQTTMTLTLLDNSNSRGYIDPSVNQNIMCQQSQEQKASLEYQWSIIKVSNNQVIYNSNSASTTGTIQSSGNSLSIGKNSLSSQAGDEFDISCTTQNLKFKGNQKKTYTTSQVLKNVQVQFSISPSTGKEQDTLYTLTVKKPPGQDLWCKFGYTTLNGDLEIPDSQTPVYPSQSQTLVTKLSRAIDQDLQTLYTNCYDSTNAYARDTATATVQKSTSLSTSSTAKTASKTLSYVSKKLSLHEQDSNSYQDVVQSYNLIMDNNDTYQVIALLQEIRNFAKNLDQAQLNQVITMIQSLTKNEVLYKEAVKTIQALLEGETTLDQDTFISMINFLEKIFDISKYEDYEIRSVYASIQDGALRVSGNLLTDKEPFIFKNKITEIKVSKVSKEHFKQQGYYNSSYDNEFSYVIPYDDKVFSGHQTLVFITAIFNKSLNSFELSDSYDITVYSAKNPISYNGLVEATQIDVKDLVKPIQMMIPSSSAGMCSYFNDNKDKWVQNECKSTATQQKPSLLQCCTTHLTTFAVVDERYYQELVKREWKQVLIAELPQAAFIILCVAVLFIALNKKNEVLHVNTLPQASGIQSSISPINNSVKECDRTQTVEEDSSPTKLNKIEDSDSVGTADISQVQVEIPHSSSNAGQENSQRMSKKYRSKLHVLLSTTKQEKQQLISTKLVMMNLLQLPFSFSILLGLKIQSESVVAIITILLCLVDELGARRLNHFINSYGSKTFQNIWIAVLVLVSIGQMLTVGLLSYNHSVRQYRQWAKIAITSWVITALLVDFVIIPIVKKTYKLITNKLFPKE